MISVSILELPSGAERRSTATDWGSVLRRRATDEHRRPVSVFAFIASVVWVPPRCEGGQDRTHPNDDVYPGVAEGIRAENWPDLMDLERSFTSPEVYPLVTKPASPNDRRCGRTPNLITPTRPRSGDTSREPTRVRPGST